MLVKSIILLSALLATIHYTTAATDKIICFYASWAVYRNGEGRFTPDNIDADLCTHVYYAFLGVNPDGTLEILDSWNEIDLGGFSKTTALKRTHPDLKTLISIGGWNAGNAILNGIAASAKLRNNLITSSVSFFKQYGFDGLDIDWEFPVNSDKTNFVALLQEMRAAFDKGGYILSVTASGTPLSSYDIPAISKAVDIINLMTYDYHEPSEGKTGHNSPLYGADSVNASVASWLAAGADPKILTLSVPFYGHSFTLSNPANHGVGAAATVGIGGPYTQNPGSLGFEEICDLYDDWTRVWDDVAQVPYRYSGSNWASYDDEESIGLKAKYAKVQGLGGVAVWSVDTDDFLGDCGVDHSLLHAIKDNID